MTNRLPLPAAIAPSLAPIVEAIRDRAGALNLTRIRGGVLRFNAWAEIAGRPRPDGPYIEIRLHHRAAERRITAGALAYQSLAAGGRTTVIGESSHRYSDHPSSVAALFEDEIAGWLADLE